MADPSTSSVPKDYQDYGFDTKAPPFTAAYLQPAVEKLLRPGAPVLDLGCGNGWLTKHLLQAGYDVYGIDASPTGINWAKQAHPDRFFLQDLRTGDLPEEIRHIAFGTILATEVIEHLYDPLDFLGFCAKILKRGTAPGDVILSTPYHGYLKNFAIGLFGGWDAHFTALRKGEHIKFWSKDTLGEAMNRTGFDVSGFEGAGRLPYLWKSMVMRGTLR